MSEQSYNQPLEDEISLKDIIVFLMEFWKTIIGVGLLGLLASVGFLAVTPNQYEAVAQVQMAQINPNNNNNTNPLGVSVEEPNLLIARLMLPTTYNAAEIKACGLEGQKMPSEFLLSISKFSVIKGVTNVVELRIRSGSKEKAVACVQAIFENIRDPQNQIIMPYVEEAKILLLQYRKRLKEAQGLVSRADESGPALSAAYLSTRDEVKFLTEEASHLSTFITSGDARQAKLVSPIYVAPNPVFPKKGVTLIVGLLAGFFLGLVLVLIQKFLKMY